MDQTPLGEPREQLEQIGHEPLLANVVLVEQHGRNVARSRMITDESPDARADGVEAVVLPGLQVQDDGLAVELPVHGVAARRDAGVEGDGHDADVSRGTIPQIAGRGKLAG